MPSGCRRFTLEMLEKLVEWAEGGPAFCRLTGIIPSTRMAHLQPCPAHSRSGSHDAFRDAGLRGDCHQPVAAWPGR
jgi:hypothetical protein